MIDQLSERGGRRERTPILESLCKERIADICSFQGGRESRMWENHLCWRQEERRKGKERCSPCKTRFVFVREGNKGGGTTILDLSIGREASARRDCTARGRGGDENHRSSDRGHPDVSQKKGTREIADGKTSYDRDIFALRQTKEAAESLTGFIHGSPLRKPTNGRKIKKEKVKGEGEMNKKPSGCRPCRGGRYFSPGKKCRLGKNGRQEGGPAVSR